MQVEDQTHRRAVLVTVKKGRRSIELPHSQVVAFEKQLQRIPDCTVVIDDIDSIVVRIAHNIPRKAGLR
jgi:hypothetical protein